MTISKHTVPYERAMATLERYGYFAALTRDGLLAYDMGKGVKATGEDRPEGRPEVFTVDDLGRVNSHAVRHFMGL